MSQDLNRMKPVSPAEGSLRTIEHGTRLAYRHGCRCLLCRVAAGKARAVYSHPTARHTSPDGRG
jgi:hypothetical protein